MMRKTLFIAALALATPAAAQLRLPHIISRPGQPQPLPPQQAQPGLQQPIEMLRTDFAAQAGGTTAYFVSGSAELSPQARTVLSGQAAWLRMHPEVPVRIEGHGDSNDTRDHALALGARRAGEVRNYLLLLGVPSAQVSVMSWGKERPGAPRAVTMLVPSGGAAGVTAGGQP
jgi:peptidoglycan-associated lipoprotein